MPQNRVLPSTPFLKYLLKNMTFVRLRILRTVLWILQCLPAPWANLHACPWQVPQCHRLRHRSLSCWVLGYRAPPPSPTSTRTSRNSESSTRTPCARPTLALGTATHLSPVGLAALEPLPPSTWGPLLGVLIGSLKLLYRPSLALLLRCVY